MSVAAATVGTLLILAILWEVFRDLFNPSGSGALSGWIARGLFRLMRFRKGLLPVAGPLALVTVIFVWIAGLVVGFALIYIGAFPEAFRTSDSRIPSPEYGWPGVLYFSLETLVTLGYGDLVPQTMGYRFLAAAEALLGFALVTASVSSIVLIYPALTRMRTLALSVSHLDAAERRTGVTPAETGSDVILAALAEGVTQARIDLVHFPIIYFFATGKEDASVAKWTCVLARYARESRALERPAHVRVAGTTLDVALDGFADILTRNIDAPARGDRDAVFAAFAEVHRVSRPD